MGNSCNEKNPISILGTSQSQRLLDALKPEFAKLYSRTEADWILFVKKYSEYVQYYNFQNRKEGSWNAFMSSDPAVIAAELSKLQNKDGATYLLNLFNTIVELNTVAGLKTNFKYLFDFGFSLLYNIHLEFTKLNDELDLSIKIKSLIQSNLAKLFAQLTTYYNHVAGASPALLDASVTSIDPTTTLPLYSASFCITQLQAIALWNYTGTVADITLTGTGVKDKIKNYCSHNIFTGCVNSIVKNAINLGSYSEGQLQNLIDNYAEHNQHYALMLSFIKLTAYIQDDINTFSQKHLDFYYKKVLQIANNSAKPDSTFLTFELAKNTSSYLIGKGIQFKGGKDANSKELFYSAETDTVISKAKIAQLQNVYVKQNNSVPVPYSTIFSGSIANSQDGNGAELTSPDKSWSTFGNENYSPAEYGLAIASHLFFAKSGSRTFTIRFDVTDASKIETLFSTMVSKIKLTGETNWIELSSESFSSYCYPGEQSLYINIRVGADAEPIVPYDTELHGVGFDVEDPICVVYFKNEDTDANPYLLLSEQIFTKLDVTCSVGGYKDFTLHNGISNVDISKPFDLLGPTPAVGSSFIVGSNEVFYKNQQGNLTTSLAIEWDKFEKLSEKWVTDEQGISFHFLSNGGFESPAAAVASFFPLSLMPDQIYNPLLNYTYQLQDKNYSENLPFSKEAIGGFIKFKLTKKEFGHSYFARQLAEYAKEGNYRVSYPSGAEITSGPPSEPYTPAVSQISLSYTVNYHNAFGGTELNNSNNLLSFYHVNPHGNKKINITQLDLSNLKTFELIPKFENSGELYLGIEQANPNETLSILFKLSEGSADPFLNRTTIVWSYLSNSGDWIEYESGDVVDGTLDLTQSGIIKFTLPNDIASNNLMHQSGLHWIKGCSSAAGSVCNAIDIVAQAILVTQNDYKSEGTAYTNVLAEKSISKWVQPVVEIKKTDQPFPSFNGRVAETDAQYYNRVSERLRHKNRAITIWDYERVVLEAFPELYKVKCINHHKCDETNNYEMRPGHVTLVPIMNLQNNNFVNPLRPYTSIGTLTNIKVFLQKISSPFVNLHVVNPVFEEVQLDFKVVFTSDDTAYYYQQLLLDIEKYLTPWAYDSAGSIEFGGSVKKSVLIDFIDELSYVDYVSCVKMYQWLDGVKTPGDKEEIVATSLRSVLVSFSGNNTEPKHRIDYVSADCLCN